MYELKGILKVNGVSVKVNIKTEGKAEDILCIAQGISDIAKGEDISKLDMPIEGEIEMHSDTFGIKTNEKYTIKASAESISKLNMFIQKIVQMFI